MVRTLLTHFCGIDIEVAPVDHAEGYELKWEDKSILIADAFFGNISEGSSFAQHDYLPKKIIQSQSIGLDHILILYGKEQLEISREKITCHVDLFAGAFFMLTRWEESIPSKKDLHGRFTADQALVVKEGFILRPIVDEYVRLLKSWMESLGIPFPKDESAYHIVPTCDVDIPFYWRSKSLWKNLGGRFRKHWNPVKTFSDYKNFKAVKAHLAKDPYDTFDYLMWLAEQNGSKFQFNFLSGGKTKFDAYYKTSDKDIQDLIVEIKKREHSIGLHPSYDSFQDRLMMKNELAELEKDASISISRSRQHFLRFSVPETWGHLSSAGLKEDSTLGYAAEPGFRCGTCKPFPVFDIHQRKELPLIEKPLLVMDVSLRFYKKLTIDQSIALCEKIKSEVKKHNGEFVFLWHNSTLSEIDGWSDWKTVLENMMRP